MTRAVYMNSVTRIESLELITLEVLDKETILFEVSDGVEGCFVQQSNSHLIVTFVIVDRIAYHQRRVVTHHTEGVAETIGSDDGSFVGFVCLFHQSHKKAQQFMALIEHHQSIFN